MDTNTSKNSKILVASPTYNGMKYCHNEFFKAIKSLTYPLYDVLIIENSEDNGYFEELKQEKDITVIKDNPSEKDKLLRLISSRNKILDYFLENDYNYLLIMDCDVIPPKNIIEELLKCNKDIVSGWYENYFVSSGKTKFLPVVWTSITEKEFEDMKKQVNFPPSVKSHLDIKAHMTKEQAESGELLEVLFPSAGCMLINKRVIEDRDIRYGLLNTQDFGNIKTTDDIYFITKAREAGFKCYCNTKIKCEHLLKGKFNIDEKGIHSHPIYDNQKEDTINKTNT